MSGNGMVLQIERLVPAPPAEVFRALTDPKAFARWMGPEGSTVTVREMDPSPGGRFAFDVDVTTDGPRFQLFGTYREVEAPGRLSHSWAIEGEEGETDLAFVIESVEGARVTLTHSGLADAADVTQNEAGWSHQLDRLENLFK